jgi:Phage terminase large subunit (GpA)
MNLSDISIHAWIQEFGIKNEGGNAIDFYDHMFLFDIYSDNSPKLVCYKAAQVGFTTMALLKSIWLAKTQRLDIIYTMPTSGDVREIIGGKISRLLSNNPIIAKYAKDKDSIEQKQFGDNIIYYRSTWTERAALGVSADLIINDEEDRSKQDVVQQYASRLQHSPRKWEWHFSNPSVEGNGVSRYWSKSDQKHWFIRCTGCNREQYLDWPDSINRDKGVFICKHCKKELTREERRVGRWVAKYKNKEYSGYWISLLMAPWITAKEIINYHDTKSAEYFSNFVLGLPYVGEGNQVTPDIIYRNCTPTINKQERIVIGCDSGLKKHYVLGNSQGIFYHGIAHDWDTIRGYLNQYERSIAVIDALPDLTEPRRLREEFPGRVFLCHYARDRKTYQLIRWGKGEEAGNVTVDRNRMMQMVIDDFTMKKIPLQGTQDDWKTYQSHFATLYKVTTMDTLGVPQSVWETSNGMDHFAHACFTGNTLVTTEFGGVPIKDIKVGDYVLTRNGFEEVSFSGLIKKADTIEVEFEDGRKIEATPEHKFWTENRGWIELQHIAMNDILVSIWNNNSTERLINYTKGNGTYDVTNVCTEMSGNFIMDLYQKVLIFIIKTIIHSTMTLATWNFWTVKNILLNTHYQKFLKILTVKSAKLGINQKTRATIASALSNVGQNFMVKNILKWRGNVASVKNDLPPINILGQPSVLKTVKIKTIVSKRKNVPVYGITVGDSHEYFANDILVANSLYWRVGMDKFSNDGGEIFTPSSAFDGIPMGIELKQDNTVQRFPKFIMPAED